MTQALINIFSNFSGLKNIKIIIDESELKRYHINTMGVDRQILAAIKVITTRLYIFSLRLFTHIFFHNYIVKY